MGTVRLIDLKAKGRIRKNGNRWEVFVDFYDEDGAREQHRPSFATKAEAQVYRLEMDQKMQRGKLGKRTTLTLQAAYLAFLDAKYDAKQIGDNTYDRQRGRFLTCYGDKASTDIGHLPLSEVSDEMITAVHAVQSQRLAAETFYDCDRNLRQMFGYYLETKKLLLRNPMDGVLKPQLTKRPPVVWTEAQCDRFWTTVEGTPEEALWLMLCAMAIRRGEVFALRWEQIDLEERIVAVGPTQTRKFVDKTRTKTVRAIGDKPKTPAGWRELELSDELIDILREQRTSQITECLATGRPFNDQSFVFPNVTRTGFLAEETVRAHFAKTCDRADVPVIKIHHLRHTGITRGLSDGIPPSTMMVMAGQTDLRTTTRYAHAAKEELRKAAEIIAEATHRRRKRAKVTAHVTKLPEKEEIKRRIIGE